MVSIDVGAGEYRDKSIALVAHVCGHGDFGDDARRVQIIAVPVMSNTRNIQDFSGECFSIVSTLESSSTLVDAGGMGVAVCQNLETMGLPDISRVSGEGPAGKKAITNGSLTNALKQWFVQQGRLKRDGWVLLMGLGKKTYLTKPHASLITLMKRHGTK
jgi:hypothetical protein